MFFNIWHNKQQDLLKILPIIFITVLLILLLPQCVLGIDNTHSKPSPTALHLENIISLLEKNTQIKSQFKQARQIKILKHPLISHGFFIYHYQYGLFWRITKPIDIAYLFKDNKVLEITYKDKKIAHVTTKKKIAQYFAPIFIALFSGKLSPLKEHFDVYFQSQKKNWIMKLTPKKESPLQAFIQMLSIHGIVDVELQKTYIDSLWVREKKGDNTHYTFTMLPSPYLLSADEKVYFQP